MAEGIMWLVAVTLFSFYVITNKELTKLRRCVMASKQEVLDAIAAEKLEVTNAVNELNTQIQALKTAVL